MLASMEPEEEEVGHSEPNPDFGEQPYILVELGLVGLQVDGRRDGFRLFGKGKFAGKILHWDP